MEASSGLLASWLTAFSTVVLCALTGVLARETRALARVSSRGNVVVTFDPNQWALSHFDLVMHNTGTSAAYDIKLLVEPPVKLAEVKVDKGHRLPFSAVSVLRPGQILSSYLAPIENMRDKRFRIILSWSDSPSDSKRVQREYDLDMKTFSDVTLLGDATPEVAIARSFKELGNDWRPILRGTKRLRVDSFDAADREREQRDRTTEIAELRKKMGKDD